MEEIENTRDNARQARVYGKFKGIVVDTLDPQNQGRITALVPEVLGEIPTGWANPCVPFAGTNAGFFSIPAPGSGVWVEFEAGDVSRPIWTGGFWASGEAPMKPPGSQATWTTKTWRSDTGLTTSFDDVAQTITIADAGAVNAITIDVTSGTVTVKGAVRVIADGQMVMLGSASARHPAVFGDDLLSYLGQLVTIFNTHLHPGETCLGVLPCTPAPPVGPMPPPSPSLLSRKVFEE
jgi:Type VI secretion system/phage-baseplate injector OB domain